MSQIRGRNEGTIYKRGDRWRAQVSQDGNRVSFSASTRKECQDWIRQMNRQIDEGLSIVGGKTLLCQSLDSLLEIVIVNNRPKTYIQYKSIIDRYIKPKLGNSKLSELNPIEIERFVFSLKKKGLERTAQITYVILNVALKNAVTKGLIARNPMIAVVKPKIEKSRKMISLEKEQVQQLLISAEGNRLAFMLHFAIITGLREGEICGLKWKDVNWEKNYISIDRQVQRIPGQGVVFQDPKTEKGVRKIALGEVTIEKLRECREFQKKDFDRRKKKWDANNLKKKKRGADNLKKKEWVDNDLIFPSIYGTPLEPHSLLKQFYKILEKAGLPKMRFHDLRHTSITLLLNELGVPLKAAQTRAGHASPTTTMTIYVGEPTSELDISIAQNMDNLVTPVKLELHPTCTKEKSLRDS